MDEKAGIDAIGAAMLRLVKGFMEKFGTYARNDGGGCGKCGICHRVCKLLEQKKRFGGK